ncbi:MAG TPA: hypothetical protein VF824_13390 [Thermoanaerobaculia bacterium]|jgi:hypothetical protein
MKKRTNADDDPLDREIDFTNARPNPYFLAAHDPRTVRVLDEDVARVFPDNAAVNEALRTLMRVQSRVSAKTASAPKAARKKV